MSIVKPGPAIPGQRSLIGIFEGGGGTYGLVREEGAGEATPSR